MAFLSNNQPEIVYFFEFFVFLPIDEGLLTRILNILEHPKQPNQAFIC